MHADRTNRVTLALLGLLVLAAGGAGMAASTGGFGVGELHARADAAAQVVQELGGDALPGDDDRYAGRVRGDLLGADTSDRLADRDGFLRGEERVAGQHGGFELEFGVIHVLCLPRTRTSIPSGHVRRS